MKRLMLVVAFAVAAVVAAHGAPTLTWTLNLERGSVNFGRYIPYAGNTYPITLTGGDAGKAYAAYVMSDDGLTCLAKSVASTGAAYSIAFNTEEMYDAFQRDLHELRTFHCLFRDSEGKVVAEGDLPILWNSLWQDVETGNVYTMKGLKGVAGEAGEKGDVGVGDPNLFAAPWVEGAANGVGDVRFAYDSNGGLHFYECYKGNYVWSGTNIVEKADGNICIGKSVFDSDYWQVIDMSTIDARIMAEEARAKEMEKKIWEYTEKYSYKLEKAAEITNARASEAKEQALRDHTAIAQADARAQLKEAELEAAINAEIDRAGLAERKLSSNLNNEIERAKRREQIIEDEAADAKGTAESAYSNAQSTQSDLAYHIQNHYNPHQVTANQVGAYTRAQIDALTNGVSFVESVNGKTGEVWLTAMDIGALPARYEMGSYAITNPVCFYSDVTFYGGHIVAPQYLYFKYYNSDGSSITSSFCADGTAVQTLGSAQDNFISVLGNGELYIRYGNTYPTTYVRAVVTNLEGSITFDIDTRLYISNHKGGFELKEDN